MSAPTRLRDGLRVEVVDDRKVFLLSEYGNTFLDDPVTAAVVQQLDGNKTFDQVVAALALSHSPMAVFGRLRNMVGKGLVMQTPPPSTVAGQWVEAAGLARRGAGGQPLTSPAAAELSMLDLTVDGNTDLVTPLGDVAREVGVTIRATRDPSVAQEPGELVVVVDDYLNPALAQVNRDRLRVGLPWTLVKLRGRAVWAGPRMVPGTTGCWTCMADRLTANRQVERYVANKLGWASSEVRATGQAPGAAGAAALALGAVVTELSDDGGTPLDGSMVTLDTRTLESERHQLVAMPQCPECGDPQLRHRPTADVLLRAGVRGRRTDNGLRTQSATDTLSRLAHHISPFLGAVSKVESIGPPSDGLAYSFAAGHNFAMVHDNLDLLRSNMRGQSGGKGRTEEQARTSAVCEALERFCGVWADDVPTVIGTFEELSATHRVLHPADSLLFSPAQYADRLAWNADPANRLHRVPEPYEEQETAGFTPARSLTHGDEVLVPSGLVWFGDPDVNRQFYAVTDSNGGAAGNTLEEAVLQGLCEVVERDAVGIWWYNRAHRPAVDLDTFEDPYIAELLGYYRSIDRSVWVLDLRTDLSMPVFAAISRREGHEIQDVMIGFGAHPDATVALLRALTELNQFLPFVANRDEHGETVYATDDPATLDWLRTVTLETEPWLAPSGDLVTRESFPEKVTEDLAGLVDELVTELAGAGLETLVVNQTRPDIDLAVVKVIVPGLRHFWRRTAPGRLYDVPVTLGWQAAATAEADLNRWAVFF